METRKQTMIFDLDYDVLKYILVLVAKSVDGALSLARTLPVCKLFMKLADDEGVLKAVAFDNLNILDRLKLFQKHKGLLTRCALAENAAAERLLTKILLFSCSRLLECKSSLRSLANASAGQGRFDSISKDVAETSSFIAHFGISKAPGREDVPRRSIHYQLVRSFLRRCKHGDFSRMYVHLVNYFYLLKCADYDIFLNVIYQMHERCSRLEDVKTINSILKGIVDERMRTLDQLRREGMDENKSNLEIIYERYWSHDVSRSSLLQLVCKERGFDYGSILLGSLRELTVARINAVACFKKLRACAIFLIDGLLLNSCVMPCGERSAYPSRIRSLLQSFIDETFI